MPWNRLRDRGQPEAKALASSRITVRYLQRRRNQVLHAERRHKRTSGVKRKVLQFSQWHKRWLSVQLMRLCTRPMSRDSVDGVSRLFGRSEEHTSELQSRGH